MAKKTLYICHTYYHVYVSLLKEFARNPEEQGHATVYLSTMSTDFENFKDRLEASGCVEKVITYVEKLPGFFKDLEKYKKPSKFFPAAIANRIKYTKKLGKYEEAYIPEDLKQYDDIYVFCDSDPIGYYLNYKHIYYHAVEDGLNTIRGNDAARKDNSPHFGLKTFLSKRMNLLFVQNGYGRYCLDMEVNDTSVLDFPCPYYVEVSRQKLYERLTEPEKEKLLDIFVKDRKGIDDALAKTNVKTLILLTEPLLTDMEQRKKLFSDLVERFEKEGYYIIFKQHPRDLLDYHKAFPDKMCIDRTVPMEMLNFFGEGIFDKVVGIFTELDNIFFAKERLRLGGSFMDAYEDVEIHTTQFGSKR